MTVLSSETRLLDSSPALLPRVNLLPPEIAEKRAFQRIQMGLGAAGLAAVAVVGLLYVSANHSVSSANRELASAKTDNVTLQAQAAKYRDVTSIYNSAAAAQAQLTSAMGDEVRYSQLLNDLALTVPSSVWVTSVSYSQSAGSAVAGAAAATTVPALGTFTVAGTGFTHDDVAIWLEAIAGLKTYSNPYFSNSTEVLLGPRKTVNFSSTASLTSSALSNRYTKAGG